MADAKDAPAAAPAAAANTKPVKPDVDAFNEQLAKAEKEHKDAMAQYVSNPTCTFPSSACCLLPVPESFYSGSELFA